MKLLPWMVLLSLTAVSCSGSKSSQQVSEEIPQIELSDADEFVDKPAAEIADLPAAEIADRPAAEIADSAVVEENPEVAATDSNMDNLNAGPLVQESSLENSIAPVTNEPGAMKQYTVQKNETLMMIAFKIYGDYSEWKSLAGHNRDALKGKTSLKTGMVLTYPAPAEEFIWNPQGNPYLIRTGDTLVGISKQVYASSKKWKLLWENNKPLIKDPNKIYAGFTIFYLENGREVASKL